MLSVGLVLHEQWALHEGRHLIKGDLHRPDMAVRSMFKHMSSESVQQDVELVAED